MNWVVDMYILYLIENGLVRAEKGPLDVTISQANVENLAVCRRVCVVSVGPSLAAEV